MDSRLALLSALAAAGATLGLRAAPVGACNHATRGTPFLVAPADGEADVPTNAVVAVWWNEWPAEGEGDRVELRVSDGTPVAVDTTRENWGPFSLSERLAPTSPLEPNATYELHFLSFAGDDLVGSFATGSSVDLMPPETPGALSASVGSVEACTLEGCCTPPELSGDIQVVRLSLADPPPDTAFDVSEGGEVVAWDATAPMVGFVSCGPSPNGFEGRYATLESRTPWQFLEQGEHTVSLVARDRAGNVSAPVTATFTLDCADHGCTCELGRRPAGKSLGVLIVAAFAFVVAIRRPR